MWERWNGDTGDAAMNSFNHYAFGAVRAFLYRRIGAMAPVEPGFRRFRIAPLCDPRIGSACVLLDGAAGRIAVAWKSTGGHVTLDFDMPANTRAQVVLSGVDREYGPGRHGLTIESNSV